MRAPLDRDVARGARGRRRVGAVLAAVCVLGVAACGSSGGSGHAASANPQTLLRQTFASGHDVRSGVLSFSLQLTPSGSRSITTPVTLDLDGPFESHGDNRTPESAYTITFSGLDQHGSFGVRTTSSAAYVVLGGTAYELPASDFAKLHSTLAGKNAQGSAPGLASFGINPQTWLEDPTIVGTQTVDGTVTEHLHAAVNVPAFVAGLQRVLARESSTLSSTAARSISPAAAKRIAADVRDPTVDVYTGKSDSALRRLVINMTVPVSGTLSTRLGGMTSAAIRLTLDYSDLNRPQTISAPAGAHSYTELQSRLQQLGAALQSGLSSATGSGSAPSGSSSGAVTKYSNCISAAAGDVAKMQRCAALLNAGG